MQISPAGNRTPVSRVTGVDTHHYTTEELDNSFQAKCPVWADIFQKIFIEAGGFETNSSRGLQTPPN